MSGQPLKLSRDLVCVWVRSTEIEVDEDGHALAGPPGEKSTPLQQIKADGCIGVTNGNRHQTASKLTIATKLKR